ncbi:MAG: VTT domain-containing protein [Acidobacteria bacterium]|nr:VTT domain-containing protein [Acidobacteriota bacterium]
MLALLIQGGGWLHQIWGWLHEQARSAHFVIINAPIYVAAPMMVVIGALDSSLLSLPEINDYLVVMRCISDHKSALYFPLFAAAGSVAGCLVLYTIMRRGGQAVMRRRFRADHIERVEHAYRRYGLLALAIPALLPPPMPFKIFVATAGALEYPRWRFVLTVMLARSVRYYVEGVLAVYYGRRVLLFLRDDGLMILGAAVALAIVGLAVYLLVRRFRGRGVAPRQPDTLETATEKQSGASTSSTSSR